MEARNLQKKVDLTKSKSNRIYKVPQFSLTPFVILLFKVFYSKVWLQKKSLRFLKTSRKAIQ